MTNLSKSVKMISKNDSRNAYHSLPIIILGKIWQICQSPSKMIGKNDSRNAYHLLPIIILIKFWQNLSTFCLSSYLAKFTQILLRSIHSLFPRLLSSWSGIYDHIIDIVATFTLLCPYVPQMTSPGSLLVPFIFDILPLPYCFHMCHKSTGSPPCPVHFDTLTISNA